jgi:hypothetical protein
MSVRRLLVSSTTQLIPLHSERRISPMATTKRAASAILPISHSGAAVGQR